MEISKFHARLKKAKPSSDHSWPAGRSRSLVWNARLTAILARRILPRFRDFCMSSSRSRTKRRCSSFSNPDFPRMKSGQRRVAEVGREDTKFIMEETNPGLPLLGALYRSSGISMVARRSCRYSKAASRFVSAILIRLTFPLM